MRTIILLLGGALACMAQNGVKAFTGARVIDGSGNPAMQKATIVVRNGKIEAIGADVKLPAGAQVIDVSGKTIMPGIINSHGHVREDTVMNQLGLYGRYGVTTVMSLGGENKDGFRARDEQNTPQLNRSRLYVAGTVIVGDTPEATRKMVDEVAALKPDIIKVRVDDQLGTGKKMPAPAYQALIDEAHKKGYRAAVHMFYLDDAKGVLKAGADMLAHSIRDKDVDDEVIALLKQRNAYYCPTLTREISTFIYESTPKFFSDPFFLREVNQAAVKELNDPKKQEAMRNSKSAQQYKAALPVANRNLKKIYDSGVPVVMGTDTGPPARWQGYFEHVELEMMTQAGLTPMQALLSATRDGARFLKMQGKIGTLEPGAWADLLVLRANPLDDIRNTRTIESVWIAGNRVQRK